MLYKYLFCYRTSRGPAYALTKGIKKCFAISNREIYKVVSGRNLDLRFSHSTYAVASAIATMGQYPTISSALPIAPLSDPPGAVVPFGSVPSTTNVSLSSPSSLTNFACEALFATLF